MIAALLIVGAAVGGTEIEAVGGSAVRLNTEGYADKTASLWKPRLTLCAVLMNSAPTVERRV